jgi:hypothetical protein
VITSGVSGRDDSNTLMLNYNDTLASIFAYAHPSNIETTLVFDSKAGASGARAGPTSIRVASEGSEPFEISFYRTIRIPENGKVHNLPPGLGKFPLFNVQSFADKLPREIVEKGGIFFPMYRKSLRSLQRTLDV